MEGLKDVLIFCGGFSIITLSVILIVSGILRWIAPRGNRAKRLNILAWIAVAGLSAASLLYFTWGQGGNDSTKTLTLLNASGKLFMVLVLGIIAASAVVLLVIIAIYLYNVLQVITHASNRTEKKKNGDTNENLRSLIRTGNQTCDPEQKLNGFIETLRSPAVVAAIALGVMALFLILPFLVGMSGTKTGALIENYDNSASNNEHITKEDEDQSLSSINTSDQMENYEDDVSTTGQISEEEDQSPASTETSDLMEIWENGITKIGHIFDGEDQSPADAFITYALVYIIVLGVGLATVKILHSIITRSLEKKTHKDLIEEYSNPIGPLAVGVATLWSIKKGDVSWENEVEIIYNLLKSFGAVIIIVTLVILVLEVIRLLMDMKEPFIRQEGRYLFVVIVGECAIILMNMVLTFFGALNNAIGSKKDAEFTKFNQKVRKKMKKLMKDQLDIKNIPPACEQPDNSNDHERIFEIFNQKITKK